MKEFKLIIALVNSGFTDVVMDAAREVGARGGTIVRARGTGTKEMEQKYGVVIGSDKEMVLILVSNDICDDVLSVINKAAGLSTNGQGIAFSIPVDDVVGLKFDSTEEK